MSQEQCDLCRAPHHPQDVAASGDGWVVQICATCEWPEFYRVPTMTQHAWKAIWLGNQLKEEQRGV